MTKDNGSVSVESEDGGELDQLGKRLKAAIEGQNDTLVNLTPNPKLYEDEEKLIQTFPQFIAEIIRLSKLPFTTLTPFQQNLMGYLLELRVQISGDKNEEIGFLTLLERVNQTIMNGQIVILPSSRYKILSPNAVLDPKRIVSAPEILRLGSYRREGGKLVPSIAPRPMVCIILNTTHGFFDALKEGNISLEQTSKNLGDFVEFLSVTGIAQQRIDTLADRGELDNIITAKDFSNIYKSINQSGGEG